MRSLLTVSGLALFAIIAGSASGTSEQATILTRNAGDYFEAEVPTYFEDVLKCYLTTPHEETIEFKPTDNSNDKYQLLADKEFVNCRAMVRDLDENDNGIWTITAVFTQGERRQPYSLTVITPTTTEATTTPETEDNDSEKRVEYLTEENIDTKIGENHTFVIPKYDFVHSESCFIITPKGLLMNLAVAAESHPEIEIITNSEVSCGVNIKVESENIIGRWFLISRGTHFSAQLERRLPFTIVVEETTYAVPEEVIIVEGSTFYVRLSGPISNPETCKLLDPAGEEYTEYESDPRYVDSCGYIVKDVKASHSGKWQIVHGDGIIHRAISLVSVSASGAETETETAIWVEDEPVNELYGPEDSIYCKATDPRNNVVFEGFGRCNVTLPRATRDHAGIWKLFVGTSDRVLTREIPLEVEISPRTPKPRVTTTVAQEKPIVTFACSVQTSYKVKACKFRDPNGRILMANPGIGEDRYTFHGAGSSDAGYECGIQITNPLSRDLGLWRCAIETEEEKYYGFVSVLCPWAMRDPEVAAAVVSEPTLTADRQTVMGIEGDNVVMSCSVEAPITYCYFRARNGTIFSVTPGSSSTDIAEYAGAGFDAGECGIRFRTLRATDTGSWSCHVGLNTTLEEQRANFMAIIHAPITAEMQVERGQLYVVVNVQGRPLDYCRFVRMDGFGFTGDSYQAPYVVRNNLDMGRCVLVVTEPTTLDRHPWTVAARITGQEREVSALTNHALQIPGPEGPDRPDVILIYRVPIFWVIAMFMGLTMILSAALMGPKKNRQWATERASRLRNSFRNSFTKKAVNQQNVAERNTANAA